MAAPAQKLSVQHALQLAQQHIGGGRLNEAESVLRQLLQQRPDHAEATHLLAFVAHERGDIAASLELIRRAVELAPGVPIYHQNLGELLLAQTRFDEAERAFQTALELDPRMAAAALKLGMVMEFTNRLEDSARLYRHAIALAPQMAEAHCNLGDVLFKLDQPEAALGAYAQAIRHNPSLPEAYSNRAAVLEKLGRHSQAMADVQRALELRPGFFEATCTLGRLFQAQDRPAEALNCFRHAVQLQANSSAAFTGLGIAHLALGQNDDACHAWRMAIQCDPAMVEPRANLGLIMANLGRYEESLAILDEALKLNPEDAAVRSNRALTLLTLGRFEEGFRDYGYRWGVADFAGSGRDYRCPRWVGEPLAGKRIILWHEQGFGDTLQFVRYAALLAAQGATVIAEVQKPLARVLQSAACISELITRDMPLPKADFHCAFLDLPQRLGTTLDTIPAAVPYVLCDAAMAEQWHERLGPAEGRFRVGIAWRGRASHRRDRERSITLAHFLPLARLPGIQLISLQKGDGSEQVHTAPPEMQLLDLAPQISDFADTAAILANLDLVVSIDTALVHLAGAMARPVWTLLPFAPDFRWMLERSDSPWYPTMKLFRQRQPGEWRDVFERVSEELARR